MTDDVETKKGKRLYNLRSGRYYPYNETSASAAHIMVVDVEVNAKTGEVIRNLSGPHRDQGDVSMSAALRRMNDTQAENASLRKRVAELEGIVDEQATKLKNASTKKAVAKKAAPKKKAKKAATKKPAVKRQPVAKNAKLTDADEDTLNNL